MGPRMGPSDDPHCIRIVSSEISYGVHVFLYAFFKTSAHVECVHSDDRQSELCQARFFLYFGIGRGFIDGRDGRAGGPDSDGGY